MFATAFSTCSRHTKIIVTAKKKIVQKIVEVGMPAEQVESMMQVGLSQVRIELQTHFKAEVANVLRKQQGPTVAWRMRH